MKSKLIHGHECPGDDPDGIARTEPGGGRAARNVSHRDANVRPARRAAGPVSVSVRLVAGGRDLRGPRGFLLRAEPRLRAVGHGAGRDRGRPGQQPQQRRGLHRQGFRADQRRLPRPAQGCRGHRPDRDQGRERIAGVPGRSGERFRSVRSPGSVGSAGTDAAKPSWA